MCENKKRGDNKEKLNFYIKQYEMFSKSHDEYIKLLFTVPIFVAALFFGFKEISVFKEYWNASMITFMTLVLLFGPILFIALIFGYIIFQINSLKDYKINLEHKINACFSDYEEIITYEIKMDKFNREKKFTKSLILGIITILVAVSMYYHDKNWIYFTCSSALLAIFIVLGIFFCTKNPFKK